MKNKDIMKYEKAKKLHNFGRPYRCSHCLKMLIPKLHCEYWYEGLSYYQLAQLYKDSCEHCGYEFEYWA